MNLITFKTLTVKNLASIGNMPITIDLHRNETTLVVGKNGTGKSSLMLDSLCFGLYGRPFRNISKGQMVNQKNNRDMLVTVEFQRGNDTIKIVRGYKPAVFEIYINDNMVDQSSKTRDYQQYLEDHILGIDQKSFMQIVMIGKANYVPFLSLKAADKRAFVERVLSLDVFTTMGQVHKEYAKERLAKKANIEHYLVLQQQRIESQKRLIQEMEHQAERAVDQQREIYNKQIADHQKEFAKIEREADELRKVLEGNDELTSAEINKAISDLRKLLAGCESDLAPVGKMYTFFKKNTVCPTCNQDISSDFRDQKILHLEEEAKTLKEKESKIKELEKQLMQKHVEALRIEQIARELSTLDRKLIEIKDKIHNLEQQRDNLKPSEIDEYAYTQLQALKDNMESVKNDLSQIDHAIVYDEFVSLCLKDSGFKATIISDFVPMLAGIINQNIKKLGLFATVKLDETFDEQIMMRGFDPMAYNQLSEGEKLRIDMAVMMAWRDVARYKSMMSCNLLVMDEIFDSSADQEGTAAFADMLKAMKGLNVFVITHTPEKLADSFTHTIRLEKTDGFTTLKQGE